MRWFRRASARSRCSVAPSTGYNVRRIMIARLSPLTHDIPPLPGSAGDPDSIAAYLIEARRRITELSLQGNDGVRVAQLHSDCMDAVVARMFDAAHTAAGLTDPGKRVPIAIVATGGYGRRELCPHSDIDITFIPSREGDHTIDRVVKEMFSALMRILMDAAGIEVGYAYRLLEDCGNLDHQTVSGLLDARLVAGSERIFIQFEHEFWSNFNPAEFIFAKIEERRRQRAAAGGTPRTVEPDLKNGPGGLRDIQTAIWLVQARETLPSADVRGERGWEALTRFGSVTPSEAEALRRAKEFLFRVRAVLHALTGQERDRLTITRQEEVARALGYETLPHREHDAHGPKSDPPPVERFMRDVYGHLAIVDQIGQDIAERIEFSRLFIGIGLDCTWRQITPADQSLAHEDPIWILWACLLAQRHGLGFSPELRQTIREILGSTSPTPDDDGPAPRSSRADQERDPSATGRHAIPPPPAHPVIPTREPERLSEIMTEILASRQPVYPVLQMMADLGILAWVLPEVGAARDLIPYDASHDYTVGQHSLYVIKHLDDLRRPDTSDELREFRMLMAELAAPEQLFLAALLHDAGKAVPDANHWETGAEIAERTCSSLGLSTDAAKNVVFLVRRHLLMAELSRLRDLGLEETIREFTSVVDDPERLRMLYLLTYADTKAVSQGLWTQVKSRYLQELYRRAERALAAGIPEAADDAQMIRTRRRLAKELAVENLPADEVAEHLEVMPADYVLNTSLEEIALHIAFARQARAGSPSISFHDDKLATFTEVTVCAMDDPEPGLLSKIAGVLLAADVNVHAAQVFTRVSGDERIALDTLCVDFRGRRLSSGKRTEIETSLTAVLTGADTVEEVLNRRRRSPDAALRVQRIRVRNDISERYSVVELAFTAPQGILYYASKALSVLGWDIHSARLSRFRGRAMATFYVSGARALPEEAAAAALSRLMPSAQVRP